MGQVSPIGQGPQKEPTKSAPVDARTAIINSLLTGPKSPSELRGQVTGQSVSKSTYHYVLRQMIRQAEVGEAKYSYKGQRVSNAVVEELLGLIGIAESTTQQIELSKNLMFLAKKPGIALQPRFLLTLEECLGSQLVELRKNALSAIGDTLWNLEDTAYADDKKAREIIRERFFEPLAKTISSDSDLDNRGRAIRILAELGDPKAIDLLVGVVKDASEQEYQGLKGSIEQAIVWKYAPDRRPRNHLTRDYHHKILIALSKLAADENKRASELAEQIRQGAPGL